MARRSRTVELIGRGLAALVLVLVAACGSDEPPPGAAETGQLPTTTAVAPESTTTSTTAPEAGAVQPVVLCVFSYGPSSGAGVAYFGYENDGDAAVEIPVGADNRIVDPNGTTTLTTSQTEVFAPGEQQLVAWAQFESGSATWAVTSADGVERTAVADDSSESCGEVGGDVVQDPPDDRTASYLPTVDFVLDADGAVESASLSIALDLDPESRCPSGPGWEADPPEVRLDAPGGQNATVVDQPDESIVVLEIDDPHVPIDPNIQLQAEGFASVSVFADVDDHCHDAAGTVSSAWAASPDLIRLSQFKTSICFAIVDEGGGQAYGVVDCGLGPILVETGGIKIR